MRCCHGYVTGVAGLEVESARTGGSGVDGQTTLAADDVVPFVRGGVPVESNIWSVEVAKTKYRMVSLSTDLLAHGSRLDSEQTHGKVLGDGKCRRVQQFHTATRDFIRFLLREMIRVAAIARNRTRRPRDILLRDVLGSGCARQDVQLSRGQMVKGRGIHAQVLGQNGFGIAFEELGDEKGAVFAELSTVEDEEEFDAVVEGLDAVWDTGGEEPVFLQQQKGNVVSETVLSRVDLKATP